MAQYSPSENTTLSLTVITKLLTFWKPTKIEITNKRIILEDPRGEYTANINYRNISAIKTFSTFSWTLFILGLILISNLTILFNHFSIFGLITILIGAFCLLNCKKHALRISTNSIDPVTIHVPFFEKEKLQQVSNEINNQINKIA